MGLLSTLLVRTLPRHWAHAPRAINGKRRAIWSRWMRARCQPVYIGSGTVLATVLGRLKMYLDAQDMSLAAHLMKDGFWEIWVTEAVAGLLEPGMIAVDVGANHGYFTLIMALRCGAVHAFEPNPRLHDLLTRNIVVNGFEGRVTAHRDPLSNSDDRDLHLVIDRDLSGGSHLVEEDGVRGRTAVAMRTRRLDGVPGARDAAIVKIDAEGSEFDIWRGMSGMIAGDRLRTVLLEFAPVRYPDPAASLAELNVGGFSLGVVHPNRGIVPVTPAELLRKPYEEWMLVLRR